jgi:GTPase SAR1 family protein
MQGENNEMIELVVSSALGRLTNLALINGIKLLAKESQSLKDVPEKIDLIKRQLKWIECFLEDAQSKERKGDQRAKLWVQEIRDVSDRIEDLVDTIELMEEQSRRKASLNLFKRYSKKFVELSAIRKVGDEIHKLLSRINEITESRVGYDAKLTNYKENELSSAREDRLPARRLIHPLFDDEMNIVGLENDTERIVTLLLDSENKKRSVISVVGMGGAGKTTLVRKVYKTKIVQESFQISAWIIVSQNYVVLDLLKSILREIIRCIEHRTTQDPTGTESRIIEQLELLDRMEEIEVRERIIKFLEKRRFLIVLDDIWSVDTWEETNSVFPNTDGSRILLTTRNFDVAEQADRQTQPIQLQLLNDDQSWELLEKRIFLCNPDERFDQQEKLELVGRKLVRKCGGLPLALVVLSGLLSKKIDYHCWLNLVDVLHQESATTMVRCTDILALSYHNLPNSYVKSCFLYTVSFPADSLISTAKLIRLWVSEGLVPDNYGCTREETATSYLNKLIQASLVQVAKRSEFEEHVTKIRIHDILRDGVLKKLRGLAFSIS